MRRLLLVANPAASGFTARLHRSVVAALRARFDVTPVWPDGPEEAEQTARSAAADGIAVVAAMGGDGIVHRVANGVAGTSSALAVIPAGTSNVFARLTGHPGRGAAAAHALASSRRERTLPVARVVAAGPAGVLDRIAVFATGVGYDADLIDDSDRRPLGKVGAGTIHYARSAVRVAFGRYRGRPPDLAVTVDGTTGRAVTAIVQIHDAFTYLGSRPLTISPGGGPAAIVVHRAGPLRLARLAAVAARHRDPSKIPGVRTWVPFRALEAIADRTVGFEADGEYFGEMRSVTVTVVADGLRIVDPRI